MYCITIPNVLVLDIGTRNINHLTESFHFWNEIAFVKQQRYDSFLENFWRYCKWFLDERQSTSTRW